MTTVKIKPGYSYGFFRADMARREKEEADKDIKYPYCGEILSDSWGDSKQPKDRLLWDEDVNSGDFWTGGDIYPELVEFVNKAIKEGYTVFIGEGKKVNGVWENTGDFKLKGEDYVEL